MSSFPLIIFAYMYQVNIPQLYTELEKRNQKQMSKVLVFGTVGAVLKVYYDYQRGMAEAAEHVAAVREEAARLRAEAAELGARPVRDLTGEIDSMPLEGSES